MGRTRESDNRQVQKPTRDSLLQAARSVFETCGYTNARVADITALAELSHGGFYVYFENKEAIFRAVADQVVRDISAASAAGHHGLDPRERIASSNRNYLAAFRANARMMAVVEEVATINDEFADFRRGLWKTAVDRVWRSMARDQQAGLIDADLDLRVAANALVGMIERFAFTWFVLGEHFEMSQVVDVLTEMWLRAGDYQLGSPDRTDR
jgi:AcrR family transcriptional regulator